MWSRYKSLFLILNYVGYNFNEQRMNRHFQCIANADHDWIRMYFHVSANIVVNIFTVSYLYLQFKVWFISYITIHFNLYSALLLWNYIVVLERIQCSTYCQEIECLTFWEAKYTIMLESRSCSICNIFVSSVNLSLK